MQVTSFGHQVASRVPAILARQNRTELKLSIQLYIPSFKYNQNSWRMSKIICDIHNLNVAEGQQPDIQQIALDMEQIYKIHSLLKHFRKKCNKDIMQNWKKLSLRREWLLEGSNNNNRIKNAVFVLTPKRALCYLVGYILFYSACVLSALYFKVYHWAIIAQMSSM